jgi:putative FmdB family regulatory protein
MMPTYEFKCKKCGRIKEEYLSIKADFDAVVITCDTCGGKCDLQIGSGLPPLIDSDTPYKGK